MCRHIGIEAGFDGSFTICQGFRRNLHRQHMVIVLCRIDGQQHARDIVVARQLLDTEIELTVLILAKGNPLLQRNVEDCFLEALGYLRDIDGIVAICL